MNDPRNRLTLASAANGPAPRVQADDGVQVLIADADGLARGMMRFALRDSEQIAAVHSAGNGREALELARYFRLDVAIVDTAVPPSGGLALVRSLVGTVPDLRVLTVASVNDERTAIAGLRAGAIGHIGKDVVPESLADLVLRAADGEVIVPQWAMSALLGALRDVPDSGWRPLRSRLTTREWEIVELLEEGASTHRIAEHLVLSRMTVYSHTKSILRKLGVNSRHDAVIAAERLRREEAVSRHRTR
jgi:DNA-binding NarL/FixJ family response regulator